MKSTVHTNTQGQGPDLVLIHGWGFHSGIWNRFARALSLHHKVTIIDLPGYGASNMIDNEYTLTNIIESLTPHLPRKATYLGWSLGGLITIKLTAMHPEKVTRPHSNSELTPVFSNRQMARHSSGST